MLTPHIEGIYWEKLLNNGYNIPPADAGVIAMIFETHPRLKELKRRRKKRQRAERRIAKTFMGKQRGNQTIKLVRGILAGIFMTAFVILTIILIVVLWKHYGG